MKYDREFDEYVDEIGLTTVREYVQQRLISIIKNCSFPVHDMGFCSFGYDWKAVIRELRDDIDSIEECLNGSKDFQPFEYFNEYVLDAEGLGLRNEIVVLTKKYHDHINQEEKIPQEFNVRACDFD
jgi:hypothetical protein